jgi:hypothetical protein
MNKMYLERASALGDFVAEMGLPGFTTRLSDVVASRDHAVRQESALYDLSRLWQEVQATNKDDKMFRLWWIFAR